MTAVMEDHVLLVAVVFTALYIRGAGQCKWQLVVLGSVEE